MKALLSRDMVARYTEPHRHYHNLAHINQMLQAIHSTKNMLDFELTSLDHEYLVTGIVYHDVIYNVGKQSRSNEQLSYDYYADNSPSYDEQVADMIIASEHHFTTNEYSDLTSYFLDLDLINLTGEYEDVIRSDEQIVDELCTAMDLDTVIEGRGAFIRDHMLPHARLRAIKDPVLNDRFKENIRKLSERYQ